MENEDFELELSSMSPIVENLPIDTPNNIQKANSKQSFTLDASSTLPTTECLLELGATSSLTLTNQLNYRFKNINYFKQNGDKTIQILRNATGQFESGCLTAILGPSGAGKTSLLNVLAGFKTFGVNGQFEINKQQRNLRDFHKMSTYIPQEFFMLPLLNVQETIAVAIDLKLPQKTPTALKNQLMREILKVLNLGDNLKTLVKDLSGGERKRLSIGVELVTNPPIMFFDEPTSGLDSVTSLQIITYLKRLAEKGRIVACVVHQPSSKIMQLFDAVLVMAKGEVLYSGPQEQLLEQFSKFNFVCPQYYNPADFVLEIASYLESHQQVQELVKYNQKVFNHSRDQTDKIKLNENDRTECYQFESKINTANVKNSLRWQFTVLVKRSLRSMSRNMLAVQLRIIMHIVVGVLLGVVYYQMGNDASKILTNVSCIFFIVLFIFFGNAMPAIFLASSDTQVFLREYLNSWYSLKSYYISKIISDLPLQMICPTLLIAIVYLMSGQPTEDKRFWMCWSLSLLTAVIGHFMGLVLGASFGVQMGIFLVPAISIPFMIFSGFFIRLHEIPIVLRFFCDISFFRYTMEGFLRALYDYNRTPLQCLTEFCYYKEPSKFLRDFGMVGNFYHWDVLALLSWVFLLKGLFFLSLLWCIRRAQ